MATEEFAGALRSVDSGRPAVPNGELEFRRLLETLPAGAYTCGPDGLITYFNQHAEVLWGRTPALHDPVDRFCGSFRLFDTHGSAIAHEQCWMALALRNQRAYNGEEIVIERQDGTRVVVLAHANPMHDENGNMIGCVNVLVDITDRKHVENSLADASRQKDEFLATLAHELRNPLSPIRNAVHYLKQASAEDAPWALDVIDRQVGHMTRLVDDLFDLSRVSQNRLELCRETIELTTVLDAARELSGSLIAERGQTIDVSLPLDPVYLHGDPLRITQVVSNILNNAAKYSEPDTRIEVEARRSGSDAVIVVRDEGVGLDPTALSRIFDMFERVRQPLESLRDGLGIGLTLAHRIVTLHGGSIEARSEGLGKGSEFIVRLPAVDRGERNGKERMQPADLSSALSKQRILVVDDNTDSAEALSRLLAMLGHEVRTAADGIEALDVAEKIRPTVVLLDIGLPKLDGYAVARRIRQQPWGANAILIAVTGWGNDKDRQKALAAGFDDHVVKPVDLAVLIDVLASQTDAVHR